MQVKAIPAPVESVLSPFGSAGFFVADSAEVASATHDADFIADGVAAVSMPSVWVAVPFGRDVLIAAGMLGAADAFDLAVITDDQVREWVLGLLLHVGTAAAGREIDTTRYQNGYHQNPELARFFRLVSNRVDAAFGFTTEPAPVATFAARTLAGIHAL